MPHWLIAAVVGFSAALLTWGALFPIRAAAIRLNLFDMPGERRVHTRPIPRIGGLAMYLGFVVAVAVSFSLPVLRFQEEIERILLLLIGATIVTAIMLVDDLIGIPPLPKLAAQVVAAMIVVLPRLRDETHGIVIEHFNAPFVGTVSLPLIVALGFTVFWIVGMMNTVNWADGIDGLAASIALIASVILFLHTYFRPTGDPQFTISLLAIALAGAVIGFLPHNWHPSRIIMGDCGAMFLGFALATISVIGGAKIATALLAMGVPILDVAWVIVFRLVNGRSPARADRGHLHHRLLDAGLSQPQVVACFAGLTAVFGALSLALPTREAKMGAILLMGVVVLAIMVALARRAPLRRQPNAG
jgi:UDP-N-acetylmuramyl pentapeptide phosphotransferase/UDP-N-acetylglucosamine-1-phosphate transferase